MPPESFIQDQRHNGALPWELIERFLANELSATERTMVEQHLAARPEIRATLTEYRAAVATLAPRPSTEAAITGWTDVRQRAQTTSGASMTTGTPSRSRAWTKPATARGPRWFGIGLTAALVIGAVGFGVWHGSQQSPNVLGTINTTYRTAAAQQRMVRLPDGTSITLAPATTVHVASQPSLTVTVAGEAYFTVSPTPDRPVTVQTANALVRVLGTSFTVRHYADERTSRVVVADGKVALQSRAAGAAATERVIVTAHAMGTVTDSGVTMTPHVSVDDYLAWTQGRLTFTDTPLRDVVRALERAYDAEIRLADTTLAATPITMDALVRQESLPDILDFVTRVTNAHYTRVGKTFVIAPGRAATHAPRVRPTSPLETQYGR